MEKSKRYLSFDDFCKNYNSEIDQLFNVVCDSFYDDHIRIYDKSSFYNDFCKYIYHYSYPYS